ncbi:uncharacterized protein LOC130725312 [Lotus japonicus]|uniref:uncharacterized protein LOC130725312 n=1 Tax=Lotus japonicus TaxID=34305 RepID=UPI002589BA3B|nr:uncharacterized protein LOC130725312 [Lotus japonicus]
MVSFGGGELRSMIPAFFCRTAVETSSHALFSCPVVSQWWLASPFGLRFRDDAREPEDFMGQIFSCEDADVIWGALTFLYAVWECRNRALFQGQQLSMEKVLARLNALESIPSGPIVRRTMEHSTRWYPPQANVLKLNFDASFVDKVAGFGLIARNNEGLIMTTACAYPVDTSTTLLAEALAFRWAITLALNLHFLEVCFETDCLQLYEAWNKGRQGSSYLMSILSDCRNLISGFNVCCFSFVCCSGNSVVDRLANDSSKYPNYVWIEEVPAEVEVLGQSGVIANLAT